MFVVGKGVVGLNVLVVGDYFVCAYLFCLDSRLLFLRSCLYCFNSLVFGFVDVGFGVVVDVIR